MGEQLARTIQYFYFIRFSLFVWLFPIFFVLADALATGTLTRGIFVPEFWSGYCCVAFFLVCKGFVALISARTVLINGSARFRLEPPEWMKRLFVNDDAVAEWRAPFIAQLPAFLTFIYLWLVGRAESVVWWHILLGLIAGTAAALVFSYVINAWYYLSYNRPPQPLPEPAPPGPLLTLGINAARTILFPRWCFRLNHPATPLNGAKQTLEDITTILRDGWLPERLRRLSPRQLGRVDIAGYVHPGGRVFEAHTFALIASIAFGALFWILYPLTAPGESHWVLASVLVLFLLLASVLFVICTGEGVSPGLLRNWKLILSLPSSAFCLLIVLLFVFTSPDRFPVLASIVLLIIVTGWFFSLLAFFFDRFRVPVLTVFLVLVTLPRLLHLYGQSEEHFVSTVSLDEKAPPVNLPTPAQILSDRLQQEPADPAASRPFVIVTATGGGLHASAWTARVLQQIDCAFRRDEAKSTTPTACPAASALTQAELFRNHILLMSTVSGGSTGLSYYLTELQSEIDSSKTEEARKNHTPPAPPNFNRIIAGAQCSSLEAVGWGLVYYDFEKALFPVVPWLPSSSGDDDLGASPIFKDRTWALRRGFLRNTDDAYCFKTADATSPGEGVAARGHAAPASWLSPLRRLWFASTPRVWPPRTLTDLAPVRGIPAFTMNTTTAELGDRFLLANYRLPSYALGSEDVSAAESFLDVLKFQHADLPLASAAQLSATFPYVSSAVRIPERYGCFSEHFVDGGYYDNDGTASAIEFLRYALQMPFPGQPENGGDAESPKEVLNRLGRQPLRIILIEIRNSKDIDAASPGSPPRVTNSSLNGQPSSSSSGLLQQLTYPLQGFWSAGHDSITARNRNGLDLLKRSLSGTLLLRHIILDDATDATTEFGIKSANDPLSWSLTPRQRQQIRKAADPENGLGACYSEIVDQFKSFSPAEESKPAHCHGSAPLKQGAKVQQ